MYTIVCTVRSLLFLLVLDLEWDADGELHDRLRGA
jgi:hypothetical protein